MGTPQVIRCRVDKAELDRIIAGHVTFNIRERADVEPGDILSFVYTDDDEQAHTAHRRVVDVVNTKDRGIPADELERYGVTIAGLVLPDIGSLDALVANDFVVVGLGFEKRDHDVMLIGEPAYLPPMTTPTVDLDTFNEGLAISEWPNGMYSCMVKGTLVGNPAQAERQRLDIVETIVMLRVAESDTDMFVRVNDMLLRTGTARDLQGTELVPWTEEHAPMLAPVSGEMPPFEPMTDDEMEQYGDEMAEGLVGESFNPNLGEALDGRDNAELRATTVGGPDEDPDA